MSSRRRSKKIVVAAASVTVAMLALRADDARAAAVDFTTFSTLQGVPANTVPPVGSTPTSYNNISVAPGSVAQVTPDSDTSFFAGPAGLSVMNKVITGDIYFGSDDDPVGLALG